MDKPTDWDHNYIVEVDGKTLEAMKFLANYVLKSKSPLSVIGAADCVYCFQQYVRASGVSGRDVAGDLQ